MTRSIRSIVDYLGTSGATISVECHITNGLPSCIIIGYASKAVDEAKDRLRASFANSQIQFPKKRIQKAYELQKKRFGAPRFNSSLTNKEIRERANLNPEAKNLLDTATTKLDISARAYIRTTKVARTIADLEGENEIAPKHISEALQYRQQIFI